MKNVRRDKDIWKRMKERKRKKKTREKGGKVEGGREKMADENVR